MSITIAAFERSPDGGKGLARADLARSRGRFACLLLARFSQLDEQTGCLGTLGSSYLRTPTVTRYSRGMATPKSFENFS